MEKGGFAALQQRQDPLTSDKYSQERHQKEGTGGGAEPCAADDFLTQRQLRGENHGCALGEEQQVVRTDDFCDAANQQQQGQRHCCETIHGVAPGRGCSVFQHAPDQFSPTQGDQGSSANQIQASAVVGSLGHVQE